MRALAGPTREAQTLKKKDPPHRQSKSHPPQWRAVVDAVDAAEQTSTALTTKHLERATNIQVEGEAVTFEVERHPHLFGRQSRGEKSHAFRRESVTYKYTPSEGIAIIDTVHLGVEVDIDHFASREVEDFWTNAFVPERDAAEMFDCRTAAEASETALKIAAGLGWRNCLVLDPRKEAELKDTVDAIVAECIKRFAQKLFTVWVDTASPRPR